MFQALGTETDRRFEQSLVRAWLEPGGRPFFVECQQIVPQCFEVLEKG